MEISMSAVMLCRELETIAPSSRGRLFGVPFGVKDSIHVAGIPTTAACEAFRLEPSETAPVVQALIDAGGVPPGSILAHRSVHRQYAYSHFCMSPLNIALSVLIHNSLIADCVGNPNILQPHSGGIMVGKTNMDQFASGLVGTRTPYGVARNPFDERFIPGGSSSGSASAVGNGLVSFALGTDVAGSGVSLSAS